jgi:hypothetical protein
MVREVLIQSETIPKEYGLYSLLSTHLTEVMHLIEDLELIRSNALLTLVFPEISFLLHPSADTIKASNKCQSGEATQMDNNYR